MPEIELINLGPENVGGDGGREAEVVRNVREDVQRAVNEARARHEAWARLNAQANELLREPDWQAVFAPVPALPRVAAAFGEAPDIRPKKEKEMGLRGEDLFRLILSGIKEVYGVDAIIAGGAARDLAAGTMDHKDVDVFIPLKWDEFTKGISQLGWELAPVLRREAVPYNGKLKKLPATQRGVAQVQGVEVDLVFMDGDLTPKYVNTFPVNAQKCVFSLDAGLSVSPAAKEDIDNKTFTINPEIKDKEQIEILRNKIAGWKKRAFYKDWKIVEPDIKEWWEKPKEEMPHENKTKPKTYGWWRVTDATA